MFNDSSIELSIISLFLFQIIIALVAMFAVIVANAFANVIVVFGSTKTQLRRM